MKQFFILLLTSSLIIAQKTEDKFFSNNETLEAKISFTPKTLKKSTVDTIYFDTNFAYKIDQSIDQFRFNVSIALFYETYNFFRASLNKQISNKVLKESIIKILKL